MTSDAKNINDTDGVFEAAAQGKVVSSERLRIMDRFADAVSGLLQEKGFSVQRQNKPAEITLEVSRDRISLPFVFSTQRRDSYFGQYDQVNVRSASEFRKKWYFFTAEISRDFHGFVGYLYNKDEYEAADFIARRLGLKAAGGPGHGPKNPQ